MHALQQIIDDAFENRASLSPSSAPAEIRNAVEEVIAAIREQNAQVAAGTVNISQSQTAAAASMAISQSSAKAIVNWQSFNVGANAKVNITQPSSTSVLLNRVQSSDPSQIFGQINANGQVVLVNPNGIVMGPTGRITASAFTASRSRSPQAGSRRRRSASKARLPGIST